LLNIEANVNYKREDKTSLIDIIQFASIRLYKIEKLASIIDVNINKRDNLFESLLVATI